MPSRSGARKAERVALLQVGEKPLEDRPRCRRRGVCPGRRGRRSHGDPLEGRAGAHDDAGLAVLPQGHFPGFADDADGDAGRDRAGPGLPALDGCRTPVRRSRAPPRADRSLAESTATAASTRPRSAMARTCRRFGRVERLRGRRQNRAWVAGERRTDRDLLGERCRPARDPAAASRVTNHCSTAVRRTFRSTMNSRLTLASRSKTSESGCSLPAANESIGRALPPATISKSSRVSPVTVFPSGPSTATSTGRAAACGAGGAAARANARTRPVDRTCDPKGARARDVDRVVSIAS